MNKIINLLKFIYIHMYIVAIEILSGCTELKQQQSTKNLYYYTSIECMPGKKCKEFPMLLSYLLCRHSDLIFLGH